MSREIDEQVARLVMGYKWRRFPGGAFLTPPNAGFGWDDLPNATDEEIAAAKARDLVSDEAPCAPYSSDPAAAWQVVERMRERFWVRVRTPFTDGDVYFCEVNPKGVTGWNGRPDFSGEGATMPEAVVAAALAALAVGKG